MMETAMLVASILAALLFFWLWKRTRSVWLAYAHLSMLTFTGFILSLQSYCAWSGNALGMCTWLVSKILGYGVPIAVVLAFVVRWLILPLMYKKRFADLGFTHKLLKLVPGARLWIVDTAKPYAFALKKDVFITVGMFDILTMKEQEAVLLHELGHVRQKTSLRKFTTAIMRLVSPISAFYTHKVLNSEEKDADAYAARMQKTNKHVLSARAKLQVYKV